MLNDLLKDNPSLAYAEDCDDCGCDCECDCSCDVGDIGDSCRDGGLDVGSVGGYLLHSLLDSIQKNSIDESLLPIMGK